MKKYLVLSAIGLLACTVSFGQTRKIMHRSHSGSDRSLSKDEANDNFGIPSGYFRKQDSIEDARKADSVWKSMKKQDSTPAKPAKSSSKKTSRKQPAKKS